MLHLGNLAAPAPAWHGPTDTKRLLYTVNVTIVFVVSLKGKRSEDLRLSPVTLVLMRMLRAALLLRASVSDFFVQSV